MITFRKKSIVQNLMPEAVDYLTEQDIDFNRIKASESDQASKVNSKSMVLMSFVKNEQGYYQIQLKDKELYNYTQKLIKDIFRMRVIDINEKDRIITAETDHLGVALDIIEALGLKYNLSLVID